MPDMSFLILLDVAPDPVPVAGARSLVALAVAVLFLGAALIVGFIVLLKRIKRRRANPLGTTSQSSVITQRSSPNQLEALTTSPIMNDETFATKMAPKSRHIERFPNSSSLPKASQNNPHSAKGAKVSATTR